jgi:hypothetical protein
VLARPQAEGKGEGFMVGIDRELPSFDHMSEVPHGAVYCQELPVERAILAFGRAHLPREEIQSGTVNSLL